MWGLLFKNEEFQNGNSREWNQACGPSKQAQGPEWLPKGAICFLCSWR